MNTNQFNRRARRAARKQGLKLGRKLSPKEIKNLKIQITPFWAQIVLIFLGAFLIGLGLYSEWEYENTLLFVLFSFGGLCISLLGVFGKKETIEKRAAEFVVQTVAEDAIGKLIDSI